MLPLSVHEFLTFTDPKKKHGIDVTATGAIAIYSSNILSVFFDTGSNIEPWLGAMPFSGQITVVSWCKCFSSDGDVPYLLFAASENGEAYVLNMPARTQICGFMVNNCHITAAAWDPNSNTKIYVGTSHGDVLLYSFSVNKAEVIWNYKVGFPPSIIRIDPYKNDRLIVASEDGRFIILEHDTKNKNPSKFYVERQRLMDVQFLPFYSGVIVFVMSASVYIYIMRKDFFIPLLTSAFEQEEICSVFFPDLSNKNSIVILYRNHCLFVKSKNLDFNNGERESISYMTPLNQTTDRMLGFCGINRKLYIHGIDNTLQIFQLINDKFYNTRIARLVNRVPNDFDFCKSNNTLIFGLDNGVVCTTQPGNNSCTLNKFFKLPEWNIQKIYSLSNNCIIISGMLNNHPQVLFVDLSTMASKPFLKKSHEILPDKPANIVISKSKRFVAILLEPKVVHFYEIIYNENQNSFDLIKTDLIESESIASFSDDETEFWSIDKNNTVQKMKIALNSHEKICKSVTTSFNKKLGQPKTCVISCGYFIVGMHNGNVVLFDLYGGAPISLSLPAKSLVSCVESYNKFLYFIDINHTMCYVNLQNQKYGHLDIKAIKIIPLNEQCVLLQEPNKCSLTIFNSENFSVYAPSISIKLDGSSLMTPVNQRKEVFIKTLINYSNQSLSQNEMIHKWAQTAYNLHFELLGDLLQILDENSFSTDTFGISSNMDLVEYYLNVFYNSLYISDDENVRMTKVRIALLLNKFEDAFFLLVNEPNTNPSFTLDILKASFLHVVKLPENLKLSIEKMIEGEKYDDAIDLLIITKRYKEAVKVLIQNNEVNFAALVAKTKLTNIDDFMDAVNWIIDSLKAQGRVKNVISLLVYCHRFDEASSLLSEHGYLFPCAIFNTMKYENGQITFDGHKLIHA